MIGEYLREYMEANGIKQIFVSKKTGIIPQKLGLILKDRQKITVEEYFKICAAIGMDPMIAAKETGLYTLQSEVAENKKAAERLQRLLNSDFKENTQKIELSYERSVKNRRENR